MGTAFTNKHRYFIQFMLSNGLVPLNSAMSFFEEISPDEHSLNNLKSLIIEINREISKHSFQIASTVCEVTDEKVFIWVNTKNDDLSRIQVGFSAIELEYFHAIMKEIITSEEHYMQCTRAINISATLTASLSRENGGKVLNKWFQGGYFVQKEGNVYLGPRTMLEFAAYLRTNTENCTCDLCSELVFVGRSCQFCHKNFHSACTERYLQNQQSCPSCKVSWNESENFSDMETDPDPGPSQRR